MQIYQVGGSVRDELLGGPVRDRDWVVVGATPDDMRALGYRPVGKDFPVFLHPQTHEEYALARTERKTAPGYHGFAFHASPDVTLEEDLRRRDLTINAIAKDASGAYIDPFGGRADLAAKVFRHVSDAFAEDPVRILRVARFAARFTAFTVAPETRALMRRMVEAGEVDALVPERVWQELARGLMEPQPSRMFETLRACAALAVLLPEVDAPPFDAPAVDARIDDVLIDGTSRPTDRWARRMRAVDRSAALGHPLPVRFAVLLADTDVATADAGVAQAMAAVAAAAPAGASSGSAPTAQRCVERVKAVCARLRVPADERDLALIVAREQHWLAHVDAMPAEAIVDVLERCDALRRPSRFVHALDVCDAIAPHGADVVARAFAGRGAWLRACEAARGIDAGRIAADLADRPQAIRDAVRQARIAAVAAASGTH